jgi:hypothetical protein
MDKHPGKADMTGVVQTSRPGAPDGKDNRDHQQSRQTETDREKREGLDIGISELRGDMPRAPQTINRFRLISSAMINLTGRD